MKGTNRISRHFAWNEFIVSPTAIRYGIPNIPDLKAQESIRSLVIHLLEPLRRIHGKPLRITSGYRCPELNRLAGGTSGSQHLKGEAADITANDLPSLIKKLLNSCLSFDQAIYYPRRNFLHLSYNPSGDNRRQFLTQ